MRRSGALLKDARALSSTLLDILVCPISKQSLRYCQETQSLISDEIGVSFPVVNEIPCLVPKDGKILDVDERTDNDNATKRPTGN